MNDKTVDIIVNPETNEMIPQNKPNDLQVINNMWEPRKAKKGYHEQRLSQSKWAFRLCFWGSIIGFGLIIWSVRVGIKHNSPEWSGIVAGTIVEAVSALFYNLSNRANDKISEFFKELTKDANIDDSIKLAMKVNDSDIKDDLLVKLSLHLSGVSDEKVCDLTKKLAETENDE